jgi:hypothetical protein
MSSHEESFSSLLRWTLPPHSHYEGRQPDVVVESYVESSRSQVPIALRYSKFIVNIFVQLSRS